MYLLIRYIIPLLLSILSAQTTITIYNQGRALVQLEREQLFNQKGKQTLFIPNIPKTVDPASINLFSNDIQFVSIEYIYRPVSEKSLLDTNVGQKIELVHYGDDGDITYRTLGKLISNINKPIFEIDGKIVIDPPYNYNFIDIPKGISDFPYLNCVIYTETNKSAYTLSYIDSGLIWDTEYNLYLTSDNNSVINGWYFIKNDNPVFYENTDISLVSGEINFNIANEIPNYTKRKTNSMGYTGNLLYEQPVISETEDYNIFHLPEKINIAANSQIRYKFLTNNNLPYKLIYHIDHSVSRFKYSKMPYSEMIPVHVRIELSANDIGNFQIPKGKYNIYEKEKNKPIYIGAGFTYIKEESDKIKLETGRTQDILCSFTIKNYKNNSSKSEVEVTGIFTNRKNKTVTIEWIEQFSDGRWEIINANNEYKQLDAYNVLFTVAIPASSIKEIFFEALIHKN